MQNVSRLVNRGGAEEPEGRGSWGLAKVFEEAAHLIMASNKGETHLALGAPQEDSLGQS